MFSKTDPAPLPTVSFQDPVVVVDEGSTAPLTIVRDDDGGAGNVNVGEQQLADHFPKLMILETNTKRQLWELVNMRIN